jgi:hypothetical protein
MTTKDHPMNQYLIEAYASPHDGKTRRHYVMATTANESVVKFADEFPDRVVRSVWKHVRPTFYNEPNPETLERATS